MACIAAAAIEEALTRGFLVEIDGLARRLQGKPPLRSDELRLQRLVWMCDINQSVIAELNAIVLSSVAQIVLEPHATAFALGYGGPKNELNKANVFVQLLVELGLEIVVDNTAM